MRPFLEFIIPVGRESNDGSIEGFKSEFVHHYTRDVYSDVSPFDGCVDRPCFSNDGDGSKHGDLRVRRATDSSSGPRNAETWFIQHDTNGVVLVLPTN
jgi:hypothetical protein